jgi:glycosyltransferase involved in cell wall biosynthesis
MVASSPKLLSVVLLSYYSKERIAGCYERLRVVLDAAGIPFELVVMDDGSKDESYAMALELERKHPERVRAYQLSRNFTSHYSIFAGLSVCRGGCAVPIPDDEQQPYETIVQMYRLWEQGEKIIIPHRISRNDPAISKTFSRLFYRIMNALSDVHFPEGGADLFFIDREVIDILNERIHPINTTTISEIMRLGFSPYYLPYNRPESARGKSRWTFKKKWKLAKDFFFSSSSFPIRFITRCGLFFAFFSLLMVIAFIVIKVMSMEKEFFLFNTNVQGWTSLIIAITFFSGLILFSLGILSEYVFRIYEEVKARPGYIIKRKDGSGSR